MRTRPAFQQCAATVERTFVGIIAALVVVVLLTALPASAQSYAGNPFEDRPVGTVTVTIANPSEDAALNERIADSVRRSLALFPGSAFSRDRANAAVGQARRNPAIADIAYDLAPGPAGSLDVSVTVTLTDATNKQVAKGFFLTGDRGDLPLLYDRNGTVLRYKLDVFTLYYANDNAWYGRPDLMLGGNPLVSGAPAGAGWDQWAEAYIHYGLYGITPLTDNLFVYGGLSAITSASRGQELFTTMPAPTPGSKMPMSASSPAIPTRRATG
jgi:hypothetical protein